MIPDTRNGRAAWLASLGGLEEAIDAGHLSQPVTLPLTEALVLGLMRQGITKYLMILGHGSTELAETLRVYEEAGLVRGYQFRNEVEMAHAGTALRWVYGETAARGDVDRSWRLPGDGRIPCRRIQWRRALSHLW